MSTRNVMGTVWRHSSILWGFDVTQEIDPLLQLEKTQSAAPKGIARHYSILVGCLGSRCVIVRAELFYKPSFKLIQYTLYIISCTYASALHETRVPRCSHWLSIYIYIVLIQIFKKANNNKGMVMNPFKWTSLLASITAYLKKKNKIIKTWKALGCWQRKATLDWLLMFIYIYYPLIRWQLKPPPANVVIFFPSFSFLNTLFHHHDLSKLIHFILIIFFFILSTKINLFNVSLKKQKLWLVWRNDNDSNSRKTPDEDDDLSEVRADAVPPEVRAWLASTFTRQVGSHRKPGEDKPKFRSVAQAIRAGILVERIYRRMSSSSFLQFPAEVARNLKVISSSTMSSACDEPFLCRCCLVYVGWVG